MTPFARLVTQEKPTSVERLKMGRTGALLATYPNGFKAVIKPVKAALPNGKTSQRGIPVPTHPYREVAYYEMAKLMKLDRLVPETVLTDKVVGVPSSAQQFMPAYHLRQLQPKLADTDRDDWAALLTETALRVPREQWRQLLALDIVAGVRDRHANNIGILMDIRDERVSYRVVAWDNAVSFGKTFDRYHNVFHKYLFRKTVNFDDQWPTWDNLTLAQLEAALSPYLSLTEIAHAFRRMEFFQQYPYRLPWRVVSQGNDSPKEFPSYQAFFAPLTKTPQDLVALQP